MAGVFVLYSHNDRLVLQWHQRIPHDARVALSIISSSILMFLATFAAVAQNTSANSTVQRCEEEVEKTLGEHLRARDYASALPVVERLEQVSKSRFGEASGCYARAMAHKATVLQLLNRLIEAEPLFESSLQIYRRHLPGDHPEVTLALNNLGSHRFWMRRYAEAARLHEEALELRQKKQPIDEKAIAESLHNLADSYRYLGRAPEAVERLYRESLAIKSRILVAGDPGLGQSRQNLASALELKGDLRGASENLAEALAIYRKALPADDPRIAGVLNRQAALMLTQGRSREAEQRFRESLRLQRASPTAQQMTLAATLDDFAFNQILIGKLDEAKDLASDALRIRQGLLPPQHPTIARTLSNLSEVAWRQGKFGDAMTSSRLATEVTIAIDQLDAGSRLRFQRHVRNAWWDGSRQGNQPSPRVMAEAFLVGQRAMRTDTANTVSKMAARFAAGNDALRDRLKEIDDIDREQNALDQELTHAFTLGKGNAESAFSSTRAKIAAIAKRRADVLTQIRTSFPDYVRLVKPEPLDVDSVQKILEPDETLIKILVGFDEVHVWAVTREDIQWKRARLGARELAASVKALRDGLNVEPEDPNPTESR